MALYLLCPRQELNLHPLLRTELFYPLNYGGITVNSRQLSVTSLMRLITDDCLQMTDDLNIA